MAATTPDDVQVGPFRVADASAQEVVQRVVALATSVPRPILVFALHVGGLNARRDPAFLEAMEAADLVYADGGSVVALAKLAGAQRIGRAPTTDVGWELLAALAERLDRQVRVALVGGSVGLADRAAARFVESGVVDVVAVHHGYHDDWASVLSDLREGRPDVTVVGLGAPHEMRWAYQWRDQLPSGVLLTCGGWFGHIVGDERRAPRLIRRSGLEWIARVAQQPTRLGPRYARGVVSTAAMAVDVLRTRRAGMT